jgi:Lrp/AsnC family transcriptional regulator for asnA, asnC and gidA
MKIKKQIQTNNNNHYEFDDIDLKLLDLLNLDVRKSYKLLAKKIDVDPVTIKKRLKKLVGQEIIRLGVMVDHSKICTSINVLFAFTAELGSLNTVLEEITNIRQFHWVESVAGRFDILALARFSSNDEISEFIHKELSKIPGLNISETFIIMRRKKNVFSPLEKEDFYLFGKK